MSTFDYSEVQKYADKYHEVKKFARIWLQPAGVERLRFQDTDLPDYTNILANEALMLLQIIKPSEVRIEHADAVNCSQWWKELKKPFGGDKLHYVSFVISGIRDCLKLNMDVLTPVVQEVMAKLASKKPPVFYIKAMENSLEITSVSHKNDAAGTKVIHTFQIELDGDWDWRYTCAKLLADVLPDHLGNLRKVYLVFGFKCQTCVKRVFEKMNWTFPEGLYQKDASVFLRTAEANELYFDEYVHTRNNYDEFKLAATNTKIVYFFHERMSANQTHDPNYQTLC